MTRRRRSRYLLAAFMIGAGTLHFVVPRGYEPLIPPVLGPPRPWVYASGVAEIAAGALLANAGTRRVGAWAVAAVLAAVLPGNVQMALDGGYPGAEGLAGNPVAAWLRVPLQVPLILWALSHRGDDGD
jgi:uncharacterized membrane protein